MARKSDDLADSFATEESGGWLTRLLADEEELDGRAKWRLGSWAAASLGAIVLAILASQNVADRRREQTAAADLARQSQMLSRLAKDSQTENNRLAAAIDTLNGDRDRLFARLGSLEHGLESVTGSVARVQAAASKPLPKSDKAPEPAAATESLPDIPVKEAAPAIAGVDSKPSAAADPSGKTAASEPPRPAAAAASPPPVAAAGPVARPVAKPADPPTRSPPTAVVALATPADDKKPVDKPAADKPLADKPSADKANGDEAADKPAPDKPAPDKPAAEKPVVDKSVVDKSEADKVAEKPIAAKPTAAMITTTPLLPAQSMLAPPDSSATRLLQPKPAAPADDADDEATDSPEDTVPVRRAEFGVDLGSANTLDGLRGLWRKLSKTQKALKGLQPIVMVKESGNATQLRLVVGPVNDAATAARLCATLGGASRNCETSVYDGQRLPLVAPAATPSPPPRPLRRQRARLTVQPEPPTVPTPPPAPVAEPAPRPASLTSILGIR